MSRHAPLSWSRLHTLLLKIKRCSIHLTRHIISHRRRKQSHQSDLPLLSLDENANKEASSKASNRILSRHSVARSAQLTKKTKLYLPSPQHTHQGQPTRMLVFQKIAKNKLTKLSQRLRLVPLSLEKTMCPPTASESYATRHVMTYSVTFRHQIGSNKRLTYPVSLRKPLKK